jgi:hypothetical protein
MKIDQFIASTFELESPDSHWSPCLQSLWWAKKGEWEKAHDLAQDVSSSDGSWVHAYLHRVEGDLGNSAYWYSRAGKPVKRREDLNGEWIEIAQNLLNEIS